MDQLIAFFINLKSRRDGDLADRINYCYTVNGILIAAFIIATWEYIGEPIQCWFPPYFTEYWEQYAECYCFVQNTYFIPLTCNWPCRDHIHAVDNAVELHKNFTHSKHEELPYYQWVPFVLIFQALCFFMPMAIWRGLNCRSGLSVNTILVTANKFENVDRVACEKNMKIIAKFLYYGQKIETDLSTSAIERAIRSCHVALLYFFIKILFIINVIGQFILLNRFLALNSGDWWGYKILKDVIRGRSWEESGRFPRVTLCDFKVRTLNEVHRHTIQCVLMINLLNEHVFLVLWFWLFFVALINCTSLIYWLIMTLSYQANYKFIAKLLKTIEPTVEVSYKKDKIRKFMEDQLKPNGLLLMQMISLNTGDRTCGEMLRALWTLYKNPNADLHIPTATLELPDSHSDSRVSVSDLEIDPLMMLAPVSGTSTPSIGAGGLDFSQPNDPLANTLFDEDDMPDKVRFVPKIDTPEILGMALNSDDEDTSPF